MDLTKMQNFSLVVEQERSLIISVGERARLKDAENFEILYLELAFNKYSKRNLLSIGSLYWQANEPIGKYHFQQNFKLSNSNC